MELSDFGIFSDFVLCERYDSVCIRHKLIKKSDLDYVNGVLYEKGTPLDWKIIADCEITLKPIK